MIRVIKSSENAEFIWKIPLPYQSTVLPHRGILLLGSFRKMTYIVKTG